MQEQIKLLELNRGWLLLVCGTHHIAVVGSASEGLML